jgi:hypothetical protein
LSYDPPLTTSVPGVRALATGALLAAISCANPFPGAARDIAPKVDQLAVALQARFTDIDRAGRFETVRRRLVSNSLTPESVFADSSFWTAAPSAATRLITAKGSLTPRGYRFETTAAPVSAMKLGDTRHLMALTHLGDGRFRWNTEVDFAAGAITASDVAAMVRRLFVAPEGRVAADLRRDVGRLFPRTAAAVGRAVVIDSLDVKPGALGSTQVVVRFRLSTAQLAKTHPHFAAYLTNYAAKSTARFLVSDNAGRTYLEATAADDRLTIRYRLAGGWIATMAGPPRPMPDTLRLLSDITLRTRVFTIGVKGLSTAFLIDSTAHTRGWTVIGRTEPEWILPPLAERLISSPLKRPFEGEGAMYQMVARDSAGGPTLLVRRTRLVVQESAMMRFLNRFVISIFNDIDKDVEREESAFLREMLVAFQRDAQALLSPGDKNENVTGKP